MNVQLSELKTNPSIYFDLAKTADVIVIRRGQKIGRIIYEEGVKKFEKQQAIKAFFDMSYPPSQPDDTVYDSYKEERLYKKGLL